MISVQLNVALAHGKEECFMTYGCDQITKKINETWDAVERAERQAAPESV
ncbi:hypothetical protein AA14337_2918 [Acetobacter malorum DSM 14337]|uniref:Uncharacterized protein n=1 Tax=Acetobacter malorum DSM 14337 TaxID=1307910 RepID=A0ABQ0PYL9_9PROT|nr:hypothetical protein AA14337_2918 [Acetobacter malorum DSM 14337]